jgi:hypothetical protein
MAAHDIVPGSGQLLVFTEFTDTARWLAALFRSAGFSTEVLHGGVDQGAREDMQMRFLAGRFQVLVSTDAGGEGIDLQSAHVMIDWDIPWSLVRLEQRAGRLHRIGQARDVHVYHLIAPDTREGRVQQVMLDNLTAASRALNGRIYDLLDATVDRAGFNFGAAMAAAHSHPDMVANVLAAVPDTATLIARAKEIVADEDQLRTPVNPGEAMPPTGSRLSTLSSSPPSSTRSRKSRAGPYPPARPQAFGSSALGTPRSPMRSAAAANA